VSNPPPEAPPHAWLPAERVLRWLQLEAEAEGSPLRLVAEDCRAAAADHLEQQRLDLWADVLDLETDPPTVVGRTFVASDSLVQAGVLVTARLYARRSSPAGLASYGEFGAAEVLRLDPDVARLAGLGRNAYPAVG
jgi:hypothetical protein